MNEIAIKRVNDALIKRKTFWHGFLLLRVYEITFTYCNLDVSRETIIKILNDKNSSRSFCGSAYDKHSSFLVVKEVDIANCST